MEGHYDGNVYGTGSAVPDGTLSINVTNIPEFNELLQQAKKEANQLQQTIDRLSNFELNINFAVDSKEANTI